MREKHSSTIAFLDFLFNLVLGFVCLVILLLLQAKVNSAPPAPENKNEFVIQAQWDDFTNDDIDLWIQSPSGLSIGFRFKDAPGMHLTKDDVGRMNKRIPNLAGGPAIENPTNVEVANISKFEAGRYNVNLHLYRTDIERFTADKNSEITITVKVIKINPFKELPPVTVKIPRANGGAEITALNFTVDTLGEVTGTDDLPVKFVLQKATSIGAGGMGN